MEILKDKGQDQMEQVHSKPLCVMDWSKEKESTG